MTSNRRIKIIAMLLAVLVAIGTLPAMTQQVCAANYEIDFSQYISGLKDGNLVRGTTISVDVKKAIENNDKMMESFLENGDDIDVCLRTFSPSDLLYFEYDSSSGTAKLNVSEDKANAGYIAEVLIITGGGTGDTFFTTVDVVDKYANTLSVKGKTATVKYSKLKKKNQTLAASKVISFVNNGQGSKTYSLASAQKGKKSFKKYFKINSLTGKVTVKKKLKKGTYTLKVKVKANGDSFTDPSGMKTVTIKIKVK